MSREATTANSLGRQPKDSSEIRRFRAAKQRQIRDPALLPPLRGSTPALNPFLGLTPEAICCRRFATQRYVNLKTRVLGYFFGLPAIPVGPQKLAAGR